MHRAAWLDREGDRWRGAVAIDGQARGEN